MRAICGAIFGTWLPRSGRKPAVNRKRNQAALYLRAHKEALMRRAYRRSSEPTEIDDLVMVRFLDEG